MINEIIIHIHIRPNRAQPCKIKTRPQQSRCLMLDSFSEKLESATVTDALVFAVRETVCARELVEKAVD